MLDRDLIGWTIDRQDGVISLNYTQNRHTRIRDTRSEILVVGDIYRFPRDLMLPSTFSIAVQVNPRKLILQVSQPNLG